MEITDGPDVYDKYELREWRIYFLKYLQRYKTLRKKCILPYSIAIIGRNRRRQTRFITPNNHSRFNCIH